MEQCTGLQKRRFVHAMVLTCELDVSAILGGDTSAEKLSLGCRQAELLRDTVHWPRKRGWESSTAYSPHEFLGCVVPFRRDHRRSATLRQALAEGLCARRDRRNAS